MVLPFNFVVIRDYCTHSAWMDFLMLQPEMESRTQGSRPRPRTQKNLRPRPRTALPRTDPLEAKDGNARGQGQEPGTQAESVLRKKVLKNCFLIFQAISKTKKCLQNLFSGDQQNFINPKNSAVLEPRTGKFLRI